MVHGYTDGLVIGAQQLGLSQIKETGDSVSVSRIYFASAFVGSVYLYVFCRNLVCPVLHQTHRSNVWQALLSVENSGRKLRGRPGLRYPQTSQSQL